MNAKCFVVLNIDQNTQVVSQFVNPSQREFLMHQLKNLLVNLDRRTQGTMSQVTTSNGIWFYKSNNKQIFLVLLAKEVDYRSAGMLLSQLVTTFSKSNLGEPEGLRKLKNSISESLKIFNANKPNNIKALNNNVSELQDMMKGNVNKIVSNVSDLQDVQRKSERLSQMSLTFQNSSRELERKLARKQLIIRIVVALIVILIVGMIIYVVL